MVKHFSVDWLAQSHCDNEQKQDMGPVDNIPTRSRPHVPCMVQPRPPTSYNKVYLQPKPKATKIELMESTEQPKDQESNLSSRLSEHCGYSSGYESEAASECPSMEELSEGESDGSQRRVRTKFTPEQIHKLEKIFNKHKYLDAGERIKTAVKLNLSETQIRTWFQNRRMKLKREVQDLRTDYLIPTMSPMMLQTMRSFQYHGFGGQHLYAPTNHAMYPPMVQQIPMQQMASSHQSPYPLSSNTHYYNVNVKY